MALDLWVSPTMWVFPDYLCIGMGPDEQTILHHPLDVLLRHSRTCKQKGTRPVPPGKPGRQRKACNACALARVACDGEDPCEACLLRHLDCVYSHAQQRQALSGPCGDEPTCTSEEPERSNPQRIPISFLLDYTSPTIQSAYDLQHMLAEHSTGILNPGNQERRGSWLASDHVIDTWPFLFHAFINPAALSPPIQASGLMYGVDDEACLAETINRLILHLEQSAAPNARGTNFNRARARSFFSRENVVRSINAFFDRVYNSNPIIYRASFNINTTSLNLVLAVLLLGATCLSPEDASAAEVYYEAAEYCIFEGQEFRRLLYEEEHPLLSAENIQLIQASLLIMLLGFKGPLEVRRRVRIQRFPALVSIVRLLDMTKAINNIVLNEDLTNLQNYIHKETVVRLAATFSPTTSIN
ncbi:hypothetical protein BJX61DRAFT_533032 [Aspergillus egyptiacus]|nr:hypothetical protein BJX61DRAFT_533032 [Aspergillus egyptiacus]